MEIEDLPYRAEYAKSSRASCRSCKTQIGKETLRLAVMVQSPMFDGKMAQWYHMSCFFGKQRPKTVGDIAHYESLRYEDQQKIKEKIESLAGAVVPAKKGKKRGSAAGAGASTSGNAALKDFTIEYAKSGRAACRGCEQKILKDEVRISKKDFESDVGKRYGGQDKWHHVECFAKLRSELQYYENGDKLPGFKSLKAEDQKNVKNQLPAIKQEDAPEIKKPKIEDEVDGKKNDALEKEIKKQNEIMFKYRDTLKSEFKKRQLQEILEYNDQEIPTGDDRMLDLISDIMTFGALEKCPNCKDGNFIFNKAGYLCQGNLSEWTKCQNVVQEPKRKPFEIPEEYADCKSFIKYKYVPRTRKMRFVPSTSSVKKEKEEENAGPKVQRDKPPLYQMKFILTGLNAKTKKSLTDDIKKMGGIVVKKIDDPSSIMAVITSNDYVEEEKKTDQYIKTAKKNDIHVVSEDFVTEAKDKTGEIPALVKKKSLCSWGSDPNTRMPVEPEKSNLKSKSIFTKSVPKSVTMRIKGGGAVDPDSGLQDVAHVYQQGKDKWNAILSLTDLQTQKNSFYKLQILESDNKNRYWLFRAWGRIATTIGGNKLEDVCSVKEAKDMFKSLYEDKTGNKWENRNNFVKIPGKMYPVDIDEGEEEENMEITESDTPSKLAKELQDLIRLIFDVNTMKQTMKEFELDLEKMPLGKLSKKQIQLAFSVLNELEKLIDGADSTVQQKFVDCSNRFYTFIPHSFGVENPPLINTHEMVKEKLTMLDSLMELEIAYNLMKSSHSKDGKNTVDGYYDQLKTEMDVLDKNSEEFKLIKDYVKNTHAATHSHYKLEVEEVFTVKRYGEEKRYKPFKKLHNRKLLWHGSRLTNFAGILSQGLRIAPPEAPVTGYMFGKGIYFADMVSKSANYCCTNYTNNTGLMLLCEVALGDMYERNQADYIEQLPDGKHSCKGVGMTQPDPKKSVIKNGVEIPLGKGIENKKQTSLLYNEYIIYDVAQVNVKYLLKLKFVYNV